MKIEKINSNSLKIILTVEELSIKNISIRDIESGKKKAQNFFFDIIDQSKYADEFLKEDSKLLVEASVNNANNLVVIITKITCSIPSKGTVHKTLDKTIGSLYLFNTAEDFNHLVTYAQINKLFTGSCSLYLYDNIIALSFSKSTIKNENFKPTFAVLSEYCNKYTSDPLIIRYIKENSELLIEKNAFEQLSNYIFE